MLLLPLLLEATLLRLASSSHHPFYNGFYYNHIMNDKEKGQEKGISGISRVAESRAGRLQGAEVPPPPPPLGWGGDTSLGGDVGPRGADGGALGMLGGCSWDAQAEEEVAGGRERGSCRKIWGCHPALDPNPHFMPSLPVPSGLL